MKWIEPWRESLKKWSQWINIAIGTLGSAYILITPEMREDLPVSVVGLMAGAAFLNIIVRNIHQRKSPE